MATILDVMAGFNNWFNQSINSENADEIGEVGGTFAQNMINTATALKTGPYVSTFYEKTRKDFLNQFSQIVDTIDFYADDYKDPKTHEWLMAFAEAVSNAPHLTPEIRDAYFTR